MAQPQDMKPTIAAIVMTANEVENIGKCLDSLAAIDRVFVLDSNSTDGTIEIVARYPNATLVQTPWTGYAGTFNTGVDMARNYTWLLRIDADEELIGDIRAVVDRLPAEICGLVVRRPIYFLGERLRYGPHANLKMLRLFRSGRGRCEQTSADEHIIVNGEVRFEEAVQIADRDLKPFGRWLSKHIRWAKKEAANARRQQTSVAEVDRFNRQKRFFKFNIYYRLPPFLRAFVYFLYRFFICRECLGGHAGISWCILQGLWYRLLVDFFIWYPDLIDEE